jgi:NitT/TauT family transport system ATP-binding protein
VTKEKLVGSEIKVRGVSKTFNDTKRDSHILDEISFDVKPSEILALCGLSGVGKSTLLRIIAGLIPATSGQVVIDGVSITKPPEKLGFVTQDYSRSLFPWLTVERNVALPLIRSANSKKEQKEMITDVLASVSLNDVATLFPWQLSGGMQQRVAIARALVTQPHLLLLDEPFASVDAHVRLELEDLVSQLVRTSGVTTILVTHDVDEAIYLADRVITLTGSPARVGLSLDVDLLRPRTQTSTRGEKRFSELRNALYIGLRKPEVK